ncbi:hypothetical protein HNQ91_003967 [Filimonas zeae]|uniref:Uncharacterized protein n=1 Tax=Filimonas zeae TaxID=1737353 RepID=A0A917J533_9BACT|nr:hypothetical protein [Filimonas zeae]MDR6340894.1 hypothetical protein [Filimonas zeae]GGH78042.1 hypothetical protein GCM10011379_45300 [Filimonas zeae]
MENTLCEAIYKIDFNNSESLYSIFEYDKHTRVEGLCSEAAFKEDILQNEPDKIATGYWAKELAGHYHIYRLVAGPQSDLTSLDFIVLDRLSENDQHTPVSVIYFEESQKSFYEVSFRKGMRPPFAGKLRKRIIPERKASEKQQLEADLTERRRKACRFLEQRGLLKEAAVSRVFAYCCSGKGVTLDIDAFIQTPSGDIGILEIKHKFPSREKGYGLNAAGLKFFSYISRYSIPTVQVILVKPDYGGDTIKLSAADLLTYPEKFKPSEWVYISLSAHLSKAADKKAPASTSLTRHSEMSFSSIDASLFSLLKAYKEKKADAWDTLKTAFSD